MFLVCFTDLKFAPALDPYAGELQTQHTRGVRIWMESVQLDRSTDEPV